MAAAFAPYTARATEQQIVDVSIEFIVGATGAVPTTGGVNGNGTTGGREFGTPVRNGVGDYSFPLSNTWARLIGAVVTITGAHSATTGKYYEVIADSVNSTSAPLVRIQATRGDTGAVAEIAQNDVLKVWLRLQLT